MRTNSALIRKEVQVMGKKLFIPVWIIGGIYGMIILGVILALVLQHGKIIDYGEDAVSLKEAIRNELPFEVADFNRQISFVANYFAAMSLSVLLFLNLALTTANVLNVSHRDNYELFHRAQPVSIFRITFSKLVAIVGGNWMIFFGLCVLNFLILNIYAVIQVNGVMTWNFLYAFVGMMQWILPALVISAILSALALFLSAIFQDSATVKSAGVILGLWLIITIFNRIYGWHIPSPFSYFSSVISIGIGQVNRVVLDQNEFPLPGWSFFLNWKTLVHMLVGTLFFYLGTIIYSKREIK